MLMANVATRLSVILGSERIVNVTTVCGADSGRLVAVTMAVLGDSIVPVTLVEITWLLLLKATRRLLERNGDENVAPVNTNFTLTV